MMSRRQQAKVANKVFEDRLGLWVINPDSLASRLPGIVGFGIKDVFLPRESDLEDLKRVREAGVFAHLWEAANELSVDEYVAQVLADVKRLKPGAVELNIELKSDPPLKAYIRRAVEQLRKAKPGLRMRINIAPFKGFALPVDLLTSDPNLYVCEQSFYGDLSRVAESDALYDLLSWGVPLGKATVCYGAAALAPTRAGSPSQRFVGLGTRWTWSDGAVVGTLKRGVIFQDDLMTDVGLL